MFFLVGLHVICKGSHGFSIAPYDHEEGDIHM